MKVRDYMSDTVITANPHDGLRQTWERMRERDIRHMPVLGEDGRIVGVISDRDLRRPDSVDVGPGAAEPFRLDNAMKVEAAMNGLPTTVRPEDDLSAALDLFLAHRYGALPVVDDARRPVGMLSAFDLLRAFRAQLTA